MTILGKLKALTNVQICFRLMLRITLRATDTPKMPPRRKRAAPYSPSRASKASISAMRSRTR